MEHNLSVIVSEQLKTSTESETAYYAIAVVNASSKLTIKTLKVYHSTAMTLSFTL